MVPWAEHVLSILQRNSAFQNVLCVQTRDGAGIRGDHVTDTWRVRIVYSCRPQIGRSLNTSWSRTVVLNRARGRIKRRPTKSCEYESKPVIKNSFERKNETVNFFNSVRQFFECWGVKNWTASDGVSASGLRVKSWISAPDKYSSN